MATRTASGTLSAENTQTAAFVGRHNRDSTSVVLIVLRGTFGGGTVTVQVSVDDGANWVTARDASNAAIAFTEEGAYGVNLLPPGVKVRLAIGTATTPSVAWAVVTDS